MGSGFEQAAPLGHTATHHHVHRHRRGAAWQRAGHIKNTSHMGMGHGVSDDAKWLSHGACGGPKLSFCTIIPPPPPPGPPERGSEGEGVPQRHPEPNAFWGVRTLREACRAGRRHNAGTHCIVFDLGDMPLRGPGKPCVKDLASAGSPAPSPPSRYAPPVNVKEQSMNAHSTRVMNPWAEVWGGGRGGCPQRLNVYARWYLRVLPPLPPCPTNHLVPNQKGPNGSVCWTHRSVGATIL